MKPYAIVHGSSMLENYCTIELFGRKFNIPLEIETYLSLEYGNGWKTPKEDHISRTRIYNFYPKYVSSNFNPFQVE